MISCGDDDIGFYIEFKSKCREVGNIRQEFEIRAQQLYEENNNIILAMSGGLDSQVMLHSFLSQGLKVKTSFLYMPGHNNNDFLHIKAIDKKYKIETEIIELNPTDFYDKFCLQSIEHDILNKYSLLFAYYMSLMPEDYTFVQHSGPNLKYEIWKNLNNNKIYHRVGYQSNDISKIRAFNLYNKKNKPVLFSHFGEHLLSVFKDEIFISGLYASTFWPDIVECKKSQELDNLKQNHEVFQRCTMYDPFIKGIIYGKYWKNELSYFKSSTIAMHKLHNYGSIGYDSGVNRKKILDTTVLIPMNELYNLLNSNKSISKKYYLKKVTSAE
jgi:hypothetical protein